MLGWGKSASVDLREQTYAYGIRFSSYSFFQMRS